MPKIYDNLLIIGGESQIPLSVYTQSTSNPILYVGEEGNVGIGITSSLWRLEVSGTVSTDGFKMSTGATSGYVLTSFDSQGNANWQAPKIRKYFGSGLTFSENITKTIEHNLGTEGISVTLWDNTNDINISGLLTNRTLNSVDITLTSDFNYPGVDVIITGADGAGLDSVIMPIDLAVDNLTIEIYDNKIRLKQDVGVAYDYSNNPTARQFNGSIQNGVLNIASGANSHAEGRETSAVGTESHSEGFRTTSNGEFSHSEGFYTTTYGQNSHAEGNQTVASGANSHSEGVETTTVGNGSHSEGYNTTALGTGSHAEGFKSTSIGDGSHAEGGSQWLDDAGSVAIGHGSHAEGVNTTSIGNYSHSEGEFTKSIGHVSHAEGTDTESFGIWSHVEGNGTTSHGDGSHAEGLLTTSIGDSSHSEGYNTTTVGNYSHSEGVNTTSSSDGSHSEGNSNLAGIRKFDCYINNGLVRIINGVDYTSDFMSGVILMSNGLTYSYDVMSCTYSSPIFSFQMNDIGFMTSSETNTSGGTQLGPVFIITENSTLINPSTGEELILDPINGYQAIMAVGGDRYVAGTTMDLNLKVFVHNFINDYSDQLIITVPNGWEINSASPYIGEETWEYSGITFSVYDYISNPNFYDPNMPPKGEPLIDITNNNKTVTWGFNNDYIGGLWTAQRAAMNGIPHYSTQGVYEFTINVTIDKSVYGIQTLNFLASSSSFEPDFNGVLNLQPDGLWVVDISNLANPKGSPIGNYSHAEGLNTTSIGDYSHTNGIGTIAMTEGEFVIGKWNTATNSNNLFVIGNGTSSNNRSDLAIFKDDSITFNKSIILKDGTQGLGKILISDTNGVASWTFSSSLFETNGIIGDGTINYLSKFTGTNSISDSQIFDDGTNVTIRSGVQIGSASVVTGVYGFAEGYQTTALGTGSHAEGFKSTAIGDGSHAEGGSQFTDDRGGIAEGHGSHAEGQDSRSIGLYSHAEGGGTKSIGSVSHSEGGETTAIGGASHAEGSLTTSTGEFSHAEGLITTSLGKYSHSEGQYTLSFGKGSHSEGFLNEVLYKNSHIEGFGNVVGKAYKSTYYDNFDKKFRFTGNLLDNFSIGDTLDFINPNVSEFEDSSTKLITGYTIISLTFSSPNTEVIIDTSLGIQYDGFGFTVVNRTKSLNDFGSSHAEGYSNIASGSISHAEGQNTLTLGTASHAEGVSTTAIGDYSHSEGTNTTTLGISSHASGTGSVAAGLYSHAEGGETNAGYKAFNSKIENGLVTIVDNVDYSSVFTSGYIYTISNYTNEILNYRYEYDIFSCTFSSPTFSLQLYDTTITTYSNSIYIFDNDNINSGTKTYGSYAHSEGLQTSALSESSHAEGYNTRAFGLRSHAEGNATNAIGSDSHAEGNFTRSIGWASHAEGWETTAFSNASHVEGRGTSAIGIASHVEGYNSKSFGDYSHSEGYITKAIGFSSHTEGGYTTSGYKVFQVDSVINGLINIDSFYNDCSSEFTGMYVYLDNNKYQYISKTFSGGQFKIQLLDTSVNSGSYVVDVNNLNSSLTSIIFGSYSHTEGSQTTSLGHSSHSEGNLTISLGDYSHAEGSGTIAIGHYSHSQGYGTIAYGEAQSAVGKWNTATNSNDLFVIGNGTSSNNRSDLAKFSNELIKFNTKLFHIYSTQSGSFKLEDGTQGDGKVLVSDPDGLASWTTIDVITGPTGPQGATGSFPVTTQIVGTTISFSNRYVYNSYSSPATGNITDDLTDAQIGIVQKIYHNHSVAPTFPSGWVKIGSGSYQTSTLNIIYAEWSEGARVEYWIVG
jgi:hypothetical protein